MKLLNNPVSLRDQHPDIALTCCMHAFIFGTLGVSQIPKKTQK